MINRKSDIKTLNFVDWRCTPVDTAMLTWLVHQDTMSFQPTDNLFGVVILFFFLVLFYYCVRFLDKILSQLHKLVFNEECIASRMAFQCLKLGWSFHMHCVLAFLLGILYAVRSDCQFCSIFCVCQFAVQALKIFAHVEMSFTRRSWMKKKRR